MRIAGEIPQNELWKWEFKGAYGMRSGNAKRDEEPVDVLMEW